MRNKKGKSKVGVAKYLPVLLILLSITIMVGSTFAYFTDRKDTSSDLTFAKVELSADTTLGVDGELFDVIPGSRIVDGAVAFSKAIDSEAIYVRAKVSFSLDSEYALDSDMQEFIKQLRNATDFNIIAEEQNGAVWSEKQGNYFYLMEAVSEGTPTNLMRVDSIDTYVLSNEIIIPRSLEQLEGNAQYMKSINFHIAFEAIQADNVSNVLSDTKVTFEEMFPTPAEEKPGIYVSVMNSDLMSVKEEIMLVNPTKIEEPEIANKVDENGTTTHIFDGWYTDATFTTEFDFDSVVSSSISLYPKFLEVSEGLAYTPIYESATNNAPDFTERGEGEAQTIIGYSVSRGTSTGANRVIGEKYLGLPVIEVAANAFSDTSIVSVYLPDTIKTIGHDAFYRCLSFTTIRLPDTLEVLEYNAFFNCLVLEIDKLPSSLELINQQAFGNCQKMTVSELPSGLRLIGRYAFVNCKYLNFDTIPSGIKTIYQNAFYGCTSLTLTELPDTITTIEQYAFAECTNLALTKLPSSLSTLGENAFYNCKNITINEIPSSLTRLQAWSFNYCKGITSLKLPSTLLNFSNGTFGSCTNLKYVLNPNTSAGLNSNTFSGCTNLNYVLCGSDEVALAMSGYIAHSKLYVKQANGYIDGTSETEVVIDDNVTIYTATVDGENYVRDNDNYYKQFVAYTVTFKDVDLTSNYKKIKVVKGETVSEQVAPTHSDATATFDGWYTEDTFENKFDFDTPITSAITLYPKFNLGYTLSVMDFGNSEVAYTSLVRVGETVDDVNLATEDENGTTTYIVDGWYTDSELTTAFEFGSELTSDTTLYSKSYKVTEGLAYSGITNNYGINGYSVAKGSSTDADIVLPLKYQGSPVVQIADNAFSYDLTILSIRFTDNILLIGQRAFYGCSKLVNVMPLPNNLFEIGNSAFFGCSKMLLDTIPESVEIISGSAFTSCPLITVNKLPSGLRVLHDGAFQSCSKASFTSLPKGVQRLSERTFSGCQLPKTDNIYYLPIEGTNNTAVIRYGDGRSNWSNVLDWPENVKMIADYAFENCREMTSYAVPSGVHYIGENSFKGFPLLTNESVSYLPIQNSDKFIVVKALDTNLTDVVWPGDVEVIVSKAFYYCTKLALTSLPDGIKAIGESAFQTNYQLALTSLPSGLEYIGRNAFSIDNNSKLALSALPDTLEYIGSSAFYNCKLMTITSLPSSLDVIEERAFYSCLSMRITELPSSIRYIGYDAFYGCSYIKFTTIAQGVTGIEKQAFYNCRLIQMVHLPDTIKYMGTNVFGNCTDLRYVLCDSSEVAAIAKNRVTSLYVYTLQEVGYDSSLTETAVVISDSVTIYTAVDADGGRWVRNGSDYYKYV